MSDRDEQLKSLRAELEQQHAELVRRVTAIEADLRQTNGPRSRDDEDRAQESENDEVLVQLDDQGRADIERIEIALRRAEAGVFGVCIDCDDEIPIERLRAMPSALRCIGCERAQV